MRVFRQCVLIFVLLSFYYKHLSCDFSSYFGSFVIFFFFVIITDQNTKRTVLVNEIWMMMIKLIRFCLSKELILNLFFFFCDIPKKISIYVKRICIFFSLKTCLKKFTILIWVFLPRWLLIVGLILSVFFYYEFRIEQCPL